MLKLFIYIIILSSFSAHSEGQTVTQKIAQLTQGHLSDVETKVLFTELENGMPYSNNQDNIRIMAFKCWFASPNSSKEYIQFRANLKNTLRIAEAEKMPELVFDIKNCEAGVMYLNGDIEPAKNQLNSLINATDNDQLHNRKGMAYLILSRIYKFEADYEQAFASANKAHTQFEKAKYEYYRLLTLRDIALIHAELYNFSLAIEQLQSATKQLQAYNQQEWYKAMSDLAEVYEQADQTEKALSIYKEITQLVFKYEDDNGKSYIYLKLAELNTKLGKLTEAEQALIQYNKLNVTYEWRLHQYTLTQTQWLLATEQTAAASILYEKLKNSSRAEWSTNSLERFFNIQIQLARQLNQPTLEAEALVELLQLNENRAVDIANKSFFSNRIAFDLALRKKELKQAEDLNQLNEQLLKTAKEKSFWQQLFLTIVIILACILALIAYKQSKHKVRFKELAHKDELTNIANRRAILEFKRDVFQQMSVSKKSCSLLSLDIDKFKAVNDQYGHDIGDELIIAIAKVLSKNIRNLDRVGRVGGEEFLIVLPDTQLAHALEVAERIKDAIASVTHTAYKINVTASIGAIEVKQNELPKQAAQRVDKNLYAAKERGRNTIVADY